MRLCQPVSTDVIAGANDVPSSAVSSGSTVHRIIVTYMVSSCDSNENLEKS